MNSIWTEPWQRGGRFLVAVCVLLMGLGLTAIAQETVLQRTAEELDALFAPIALYPDALIAVMLPAATAPGDLVVAAQYNAAGGAAEQLDAQPWDDSVRTLAHYPEVLQWMAANLVWTEAVGNAFRLQPADVMAAIQRLRTRAQALGNLPSTPQQRVVNEQNLVMIVPADPEVLYVPQYDPQVIYVQPAPFGCPWLNFGFCWQIGAWHRYDFDWRRCAVRIRERHPQFRQPVEVIRTWHPAPVAQHQSALKSRSAVTAPQAYPVASLAAPQLQANPGVASKSPASVWPAQREAPPHNAGLSRSVERTPETTGVRHESNANHERAVENQGAINRVSAQPMAHSGSPAVSQPVFTPVAPLKQPVPHYEAAARPEFRVPQAPPALARPNGASAPQQEPRTQRSAYGAPPATQPAVTHSVHAAPPALSVQRQAPSSGNNQSDRTSGNGERSANGHWGNMARGN